MHIWAIADLHLSFGTPGKEMDIFGEDWKNHPEKIAKNWRERVNAEDLVLIAGDISWAKDVEGVRPDLEWIASLPGTKVMIKGNHDYWWPSQKKLQQLMPPSLHAIYNNHFRWHDVEIAGSRLWDSPAYYFDGSGIEKALPQDSGVSPNMEHDPDQEAKIFSRELQRLELSLQTMQEGARYRIAMTHYPPIGDKLIPSEAHRLLKKYDVDVCVFGHLHGLVSGSLPFGECEGIRYCLTACDYLNFTPLLIGDL